MALIERLMGLEEPHIPVHDFFAAGQEIISGRLTVAQVKSAFSMNAAAASEFDAWVALAPTGGTATALANKALYVNSQHSILILAEGRYPGYDTPNNVRIKIGIPTL